MSDYESLLDFCNTQNTIKEENLIYFETINLNTFDNINSLHNNINKIDISIWKKETNIRKLLLTLQNVLILINIKWEPVEFSNLLDIKQIKKIYNKAMTFIHPDKCIKLNEANKILAKEIYDCLYEAYQKEINNTLYLS